LALRSRSDRVLARTSFLGSSCAFRT